MKDQMPNNFQFTARLFLSAVVLTIGMVSCGDSRNSPIAEMNESDPSLEAAIEGFGTEIASRSEEALAAENTGAVKNLVPEVQPSMDVLQFRGPQKNSLYSGQINPQALENGAKIIWQTNLHMGFSSVSISGNKLVTIGSSENTDTVWCLESDTGNVIWQYTFNTEYSGYPGAKTTPTIDGESVFTLASKGMLHSFDINSGKINWSKNISEEFGAVPTRYLFSASVGISGDILVLNANKSGIALNKKTGALIWSSSEGTGGYAAPVFFKAGDIEAVALFGAEALYGVELATGRVLWTYEWITYQEVNVADPLVFDDKIFISSGYATGCVLLRFTDSSITQLWQNKNMCAHFTSPVYYNGFIYGVSGNTSEQCAFRALDPETGTVVFQKLMRLSNFIFVNNTAVIISEGGGSFRSTKFPLMKSIWNRRLRSNKVFTGQYRYIQQAGCL